MRERPSARVGSPNPIYNRDRRTNGDVHEKRNQPYQCNANNKK
jgi:hypothetical protein